MKRIASAWPLLFVLFASAPLWAAGPPADRTSLLTIDGYQGRPMQFDIREAPVVSVQYADRLDPKRFDVLLNGKSVSTLFHPKAGATEEVNLPLNQGMNRLVFKLNSVDYPPYRKPEAIFAVKMVRKAVKSTYGAVREWHTKPGEKPPEIDPLKMRFNTPAPRLNR